jgi:hypothetical protein
MSGRSGWPGIAASGGADPATAGGQAQCTGHGRRRPRCQGRRPRLGCALSSRPDLRRRGSWGPSAGTSVAGTAAAGTAASAIASAPAVAGHETSVKAHTNQCFTILIMILVFGRSMGQGTCGQGLVRVPRRPCTENCIFFVGMYGCDTQLVLLLSNASPTYI